MMAEKIKCPYCGKEIVTRKDKISKKVSASGYQALEYEFGDDWYTVNFSFNGGMDKDEEDIENFSEEMVLGYLATCYANSCLTLISILEKYNTTENLTEKRNIASRYLPAMFCFRQYVELKLKELYIDIKNELPNFIHDIEVLKNSIERELKVNIVAFDQALDFIKDKEKRSQTFFRYLSKNASEYVDKLQFCVAEFDTVRKLILNIGKCSQEIKNRKLQENSNG